MNSEKRQSGFLQRLQYLIGDEKPYPWAARIGITQATFNRMWKEGIAPKADILLLISEKTECSIDWLLTGKGEMRRGDKPSEEDKRLREQYPLSPLTAEAFGISDSQNVAYVGQKDHPYAWFHQWIDEELKGKNITEVMRLAVKIKAEIDKER